MDRECSCRGTNYWCIHCDGRGYLRPNNPVEITPASRKQHSLHHVSSRRAGKSASATKLECGPIPLARKGSPDQSQAGAVSKVAPDKPIFCPLCRRTLPESQFVEHYRHTHHRNISNALARRSKSVGQHTRTPKNLVPCSCCLMQVREDRLAKHVKKIHRLSFVAQSMPKKARTFDRPKSAHHAPRIHENATPQIFFDTGHHERHLDGSRQIYFAGIRDSSGRFDSTPSFDSYDAESRP